MAEEEYTVVKNVRGKADVRRWFGHKKRKNDGHIEQNIAVCFDCGVSVKLAGGTSNLQTHIRRHHPLKQAVRSKYVVQAEASTLQSTVTQVPSTSNVKTVSVQNSKQTTIMAAFGATSSQKPYPAQSPRASEITKQLGRFLAEDMRPYSLVESDHFKSLLRTLDPRYRCPSRTYFSETVIPMLYNEVRR